MKENQTKAFKMLREPLSSRFWRLKKGGGGSLPYLREVASSAMDRWASDVLIFNILDELNLFWSRYQLRSFERVGLHYWRSLLGWW